MKTKDFSSFKNDVDNWIKNLNSELNNFRDLPNMVNEHRDNIDHNYELLQEMRAEMIKLKDEISALRMVQLLHLKTDLKKKN